MRLVRSGAALLAVTLGASCATISGLDQLNEVDCGPAPCTEGGSDGTNPEATASDASRGAAGPDGTTDGRSDASSDGPPVDARSDVGPGDSGRVDGTQSDSGADVALLDSGVDTSTGIDTGVDTGGPCPTLAGPTLVPVGSDGFCIDSTEVTRDDYAPFLASNPTNPDPLRCGWNTSFTPAAYWPPASNEGNYPVGGVDWCDAFAYCAWAGKRLCGDIAGGSVPGGSYADPSQSQWMAACSADGAQSLPYGNTFVPGACNDQSLDAGGPIAVASLPTCQGGFAGIFDMIGNLDEWEDCCDPAPDGGGPDQDLCHLRGEAFGDTTAATTCSAPEAHARSDTILGDPPSFRCCWP